MARLLLGCILASLALAASAQDSSSSANPKRTRKPAASTFDSGSILNGVYRNKAFALSLRIPTGWVLRTEEMNTREEQPSEDAKSAQSGARVLLAAFSRPPEAHAEDVNSSILVVAEPISTYPGLKDAAQYFGPLTEVAKAQGFSIDEDPYEIAVGAKNLVRADFHKDVGSRVMRQSTLALLSHGYAVSVTIIAGTEDEVEDLISNLSFRQNGK
ncbi:MAG TPA: hypothetical protein VFL34_11165 [Candidatus Sulfotelmatobacter sp.]|nr:hypothetical protein [Candidatus Sulfotelmatobacter sp.]